MTPSIATIDIRTVGDMLSQCREYRTHLLQRLGTFIDSADLSSIKPTETREDVIDLLREFLNRKQLWNLLSEAFHRRIHVYGVSPEQSLYRIRLLRRLTKEAEALYSCFCRHQQAIDPKVLVALLKGFLLGSLSMALTHLEGMYKDATDELYVPPPFSGIDLGNEDVPCASPYVPIPWFHPKEKAPYP